MGSISVNVVVQGLLTGLVYGLMALGLSVIFGVVRVVNFAHGELTVVAMYSAFLLFQTFGLDPLLAVLPIAAAFFVLGYALQSLLINPFVGRPEHEQFILLVGLGLACVGAAGALMVTIADAAPGLASAYTLLAFTIVIIGGLGSMAGALAGGVLIGVSEALAGFFAEPSMKSMFSFALLVAVLVLRPQGLLGRRA